jgi:hypothetical protein
MRRVIFVLFVIISNQSLGQFHFRLYLGRTLGDIVTERQETYNYNGTQQFQFGQYHYNDQGSAEWNCAYTNTARIGLGFKVDRNRFFVEFSPTFDLSSFRYSYQSSGNYTYFWDEAQLAPISQAQILAYGWPQSYQYSESSKKHEVFAVGLNFNIGYQISDRHSIKLFVCETKMPPNQFGTDVDWDDSDKRYVTFDDYSYYEIFTNRSLGLSYEYKFAKNFFVNIQPSIPVKAFDQNGEDFHIKIEKTPFVNVNVGLQLPNKSEKTKKSKVDKKRDTPQIL